MKLKQMVYVFPGILWLTACGGGNGGYSSGGSGGYGGSVSSAVMTSSSASSAITSSASSAVNSSVASSSGAVPINQAITTIGGTFVAQGSVNILVPSGTDFVMQSQNKDGMTLYVFDKDVPGQSACATSGCVTTWPPLLAQDNSNAVEPLSIITRADGHKQWALRNKPLYFFAGDAKAGDVAGEGVANLWHVAKYEPVLLNSAAINANDGDYLVSSGKVLVGMPDGDNTKFIAEQHDRDGFSLYTFDNDATGVSNCTGGCLQAWPPLLAQENDKAEAPYSIIDRSMGSNPSAKQWAYQGKPLYYFVNDTAAGQTTGKAIPKWHLARPLPFTVKNNSTLGSLLVATGLIESSVPVNSVETVSKLPRHGFTLYTFDNDVSGTSNCTDACLTNWPALIANDGAVAQPPYTIITRASGEKQWAINGMPLYFFAGDTKAGDTNGEGVANKWVVARVPAVAVKNNPIKNKLLIAHGNLLNATGGADTAHANFTLYTFDKDPIGQTTCTGGCLAAWPALYAPADAQAFGDFTVITRTDTTAVKQWAYKGKPLYFYVGDTAAGDVNGEYTDWTIARP